jgi:hypothetical protein
MRCSKATFWMVGWATASSIAPPEIWNTCRVLAPADPGVGGSCFTVTPAALYEVTLGQWFG